jgi:hypothetical protein
VLIEDYDSRFLNRHPAATETFRHGKVKMRWQDRKVEGGKVTTRMVAPKPRAAKQGFPWHLMGN